MIEIRTSITYVKTFADRLRYVREMRRLTQAELARACGISQGAIANYESQTRLAPRAIFKLAKVLNVNAQWLYDGSGPIELSAQSDKSQQYKVKEQNEQRVIAAWPFREISPDVWWQLSEPDQQLIENTIMTLINNLLKGSDIN